MDVLLLAIDENIVREVVNLLGEHPELSYIEPDEVSDHRLEKTFPSSILYFRFLMFLQLFQKITCPAHDLTPEHNPYGHSSRPEDLESVAHDLFTRQDSPPSHYTTQVSDEVQRICRINLFTQFLEEVGAAPKGIPSNSQMSRYL